MLISECSRQSMSHALYDCWPRAVCCVWAMTIARQVSKVKVILARSSQVRTPFSNFLVTYAVAVYMRGTLIAAT